MKKSKFWNWILAPLFIGAISISCCSGDPSDCEDELVELLKAEGYTHISKPSWNSRGRFWVVQAVDEEYYPVGMYIHLMCNCEENYRTYY